MLRDSAAREARGVGAGQEGGGVTRAERRRHLEAAGFSAVTKS